MMSMRLALGILSCILWSPPAHAQRRGTARIEIQASVPGASVFVDGRKVGTTPVGTLFVAPGKHRVKVKKLGHLDHDEEVSVAANEVAQVVADLLPFAGVLVVRCNAPGATVVIDGKAVGQAPLEREVDMGSHVIKVMATGFGEYSENIAAVPGETLTIDARLKKVSAPADELELAPLDNAGKPPAAEPELELELLPPEPELEPPPQRPANTPSVPEPDALELEAVPLPIVEPPPPEQPQGPFAPVVATTGVGPPWWQRWYTLAGAGAAVATATTVIVLLVRGGNDERAIDGTLRFGESPSVLAALAASGFSN